MPSKLLALLLLATGFLAATPARASGDFTCSVDWKLKLTELNDCDNQPFLSPGNDSRVNLQLLLLDAGKARLHAPGPPKAEADRWPNPVLAGPSPFTLNDLDDLIAPPPAPASGEDSSDHADGEGSRCDSNASGADQFNTALAATPAVPAADRQALAAGRAALRPTCVDERPPAPDPPPAVVRSVLGKPFAAYLAGAQAFYDGRYDVAAQDFGVLQTSAQPWLRETARYMLGRVALNHAQAAAFDQYGDLQPGKADAKALAEADAAFNAYLRDYPNGAYAASARGLLRRAAWLGGRTGDLAKDFAQAFDAADPGKRNVTEVALVQEADSKLLADADPTGIREPMLLAVFDLLHMRTADGAKDKPIDRATLDAQRPVFASQPDLFTYLLAAHAFYDEKEPAAALALLPAASVTAPMSYLDFSRQVLRGLALEETGDRAGARAHWLGLMPAARPPFQHAALELALAMNEERGGATAQVFAAGSPIADADLREILLRNAAGPALLRQQAKSATAPEHERRLALYVLLYKELTRGRYQAFLGDLALLPPPPPPATGDNPPAPNPDFSPFRWDGKADDDGYACPPLRALAGALARDPQATANLVCLSEFVRVSGVTGEALDTRPPADELGGAPSQFPGGPYWRLDSYQALLANPKTQGAQRAYVLYRAVKCYAASGANHCDGKDVDKAQRKAWFETLKKDYASSVWAQRLKYYW